MGSVVKWIVSILALLAMVASTGLIVGVFVGSVAGTAVIVFEALR